MAKIENMHYTICLQLISSSGQIALPSAFARLEQRGVKKITPLHSFSRSESEIETARDREREVKMKKKLNNS